MYYARCVYNRDLAFDTNWNTDEGNAKTRRRMVDGILEFSSLGDEMDAGTTIRKPFRYVPSTPSKIYILAPQPSFQSGLANVTIETTYACKD